MVLDFEYRRRPSEGSAGVIDVLEPTWLYRVDGNTGEIEATRRFPPFELADMRVLPPGTNGSAPGPQLFTLLYREGVWSIETFDGAFSSVASQRLSARDVALGAVVVPTREGQTPLVFVYEDGELALYDVELGRKTILEGLGAVTTTMTAAFQDDGTVPAPVAALNRRLPLETARTDSATPLRMAFAVGDAGLLAVVVTDSDMHLAEFTP